MLILKNVNKVYQGRNFKVHALQNINLQVNQSEYICIIGKSGSGKSSLLKIIGLLDIDYSGEYYLNQKNISKLDDKSITNLRKKTGFIFQDFQLIDRYTIRKNLEIASAIKSDKPNVDEVYRSLQQVDMIDKINSYPDELSGGQKQRVAIARAMLSQPDVLIADEPTGAIDEENTEIILRLLKKIHKSTLTTIIMVTHDKEVALQADRVVQLKDGRIISDIFHKEH